MSNVHPLRLRPRDQPVIGALPDEVRRTLAIDFLASDRSVSELVSACSGKAAQAESSRATLACVLMMVRDDAPQDLVLIDPPLYRRLRERITDMRVAGWIAPSR